ncbi:MAG: DUF4139 domain-containing protein [Polyangiaceae bacterium]|nr:DUF4139 domain-containing protein [Polyangiaceae bacterium]
MTTTVCNSRIENVTVYARGAVVRRRAALPTELPQDAFQVVLEHVTALADPGSLRASTNGARDVIGVRAELVVIDRKADTTSFARREAELVQRREHLVTVKNHAEWRRELLASVQPGPSLVRKKNPLNPAERMADALAVVSLVEKEMTEIDAVIAEHTLAIEAVDREIEAVRIEAAQQSAAEAKSDAPPELRVIVLLGAQKQGQQPTHVEIEYTVSSARWWPTYRARFSEAATRAELTLSALVAQASGEDWNGVALKLSTGDLLRDARLPQLTSLRLGRSQRPKQRGYRPPPEGLDIMFEGYDRFVAQTKVTVAATVSVTTAVATDGRASWPAPGPEGAAYQGHADDLDEPTAVARVADLAKSKSRLGALIPQQAPGFGAPPEPKAAMPAMPPMAMAAPAAAMEMPAPRGGGFRFRKSKPEALFEDRDEQTLGGMAPDLGETLPIEPTDAWLDFDSLHIDPQATGPKRGRLVRISQRGAVLIAAAETMIERIEPPPGTTDPRASRGLFDVVYTASATSDVPSTGRPHRVHIAAHEATCTQQFVAVPRETQEVFRKALLTNPFKVPLLTGPVEVIIDGALATLTRLSYTDRDGTIAIGLGVEERVRVARTSRTEESTTGLLGGTTNVDHFVTTELSSAIGRPITVIVVDRLPVSDEKDVEIKLIQSEPKPAQYTQAELGQPLRKGLKWEVNLAAGAKTKIECSYRITLPSKMEIVGGNRRE